MRKGAFQPRNGDVLTQFCKHVCAEFAKPMVVYDYLGYFRRRALATSRSKSVPIVALVLYATWLEHWLNMVITVAMLRRRDSEPKLEAYFAKRPHFKTKLGLLGASMKLPPLPKSEYDLAIKVVHLRNGYVHYAWRGLSPSKLAKHRANVRDVVSKCKTLLPALRRYEATALDAPGDALAKKLFPRVG